MATARQTTAANFLLNDEETLCAKTLCAITYFRALGSEDEVSKIFTGWLDGNDQQFN